MKMVDICYKKLDPCSTIDPIAIAGSVGGAIHWIVNSDFSSFAKLAINHYNLVLCFAWLL